MIRRMHRVARPSLFACLAMVLLASACRRAPATPLTPTHTIAVDWGEKSKTGDESINAFVTEAVDHCTSRNYEECRLLWHFDHQPPSRKHFAKLWQAVERVEIRRVQEVKFRLPSGKIENRDEPVWVFHAYVDVSEDARMASGGKLRDSDLFLLIVRDRDSWRFSPAPPEIRDTLARVVEGQDATEPPPPGP